MKLSDFDGKEFEFCSESTPSYMTLKVSLYKRKSKNCWYQVDANDGKYRSVGPLAEGMTPSEEHWRDLAWNQLEPKPSSEDEKTILAARKTSRPKV